MRHNQHHLLFKQSIKESTNAYSKTMLELQATDNQNNQMRDMPTPMEHRTPETNSQALPRHIPQTRQAHTRQRHPLLAMRESSHSQRSLDSRSCDSRRSGFTLGTGTQIMQQQTAKQPHPTQLDNPTTTPHTNHTNHNNTHEN
jgi:hypothetical protein